MKTTRNYLAIFITTSFAGSFTLRILALEFLYHQMGDFWSGIGSTLFATGFMGLVIGYFIARNTLRLEAICAKASRGESISKEERAEALGVYRKVNMITIGTNVLAFIAGQLVVMTLDVRGGVVPYRFSCCVLIMIQASLVGTIAAMYEIYSFNNMMAEHRKTLGIHDISGLGSKKPMSISGKFTLVTTVTLLFTGVNAFSAAYGHIAFPGTLGDQEPLAAYLRFGAEAIGLSVAICVGLIQVIAGELKGRIADTSTRLRDLGEKGDLASRINLSMNDDFGALTSDLNGFIAQLGSLVGRLREGTGIVSGSVETLSRSAAESIVALEDMQRSEKTIEREEREQGALIAKASDEIRLVAENAKNVENQVLVQSSAMQQSSASVNEMAASVESVAKMAREAEGLAADLIRSSGQGSGAISSAIGSINDIQAASAAVAEIVKSIHDIATRTNLLSMNAAIEAAHAGAAGKGFAIVANEVRSLAESSAKSASEIQKHITAMIDKIDRGVSSISEAGTSFGEITAGIGQTAGLIQTITRAMEEQRVGAAETSKATAEVVEAIDAIRELSRKQREYAVSMESAMGDITSAARTIGEALRESEVKSRKLDDAMQNVDKSIEEHDRAVASMKQDIGIFRL